jgi:hypothetical protein
VARREIVRRGWSGRFGRLRFSHRKSGMRRTRRLGAMTEICDSRKALGWNRERWNQVTRI